jgi:hypothetical protein
VEQKSIWLGFDDNDHFVRVNDGALAIMEYKIMKWGFSDVLLFNTSLKLVMC